MPEPTDRLGLNTFERGEEWDHTDTVEALDELAIPRGSIDDRPTEGIYDNVLYYATDPEELALYRWDLDTEEWVTALVAPENITPEDLGFDPVTADELDAHEGDVNVHLPATVTKRSRLS